MTASPEQAAFEEIIRSYYQAWFRYHPEAAVEAGVPGYAHLLTPCDEESLGALVSLNDGLRVSLEELNRTGFSPDQEIDFQILYGAALLENRRILEWEARCPDPERLLPVNAIYQLTIRAVENFADVLPARLNAIPEYLQGVREYLEPRAAGIPPLWQRAAVTAARQGEAFLRELPAHPKIADEIKPITGLETALDLARRALIAHADYLESLSGRARGNFSCGGEYFDSVLRYRHFLDAGASRIYEMGQGLFDHTRERLRDICKELYGHDDIAAATRAIQANHPAREELLSAYRRQMHAARDFLAERGIVTLPRTERLDVVATPVFLRHQIPFAAYHEPAPDDPEQHGYYYVTPPADDAQLAEHDHASLMHTCVHEAWPGHHLQFVTANLTPAARTLPRLLNPSATLYEGWALYSEQLMQEQGFLHRPEQRFILLRDRLWRVLRILIDIDIHTRDVTVDEAAARMQSQLGFHREQALADLTWYSRAPAVPLGYATGWMLINTLRDAARESPDFSLRVFHDRLLSAGSVALPLAVRRAFGEDAWRKVNDSVFGGGSDATA